MTTAQGTTRPARAGLHIGSICAYVYFLLASQLLLRQPVYGGAMYLFGQAGRRIAALFGREFRRLPRISRIRRAVLPGSVLALTCALLVLCPFGAWNRLTWLLAVLVGCMLLGDVLSLRTADRCTQGGRSLLRITAARLLPSLPALWALLVLPGKRAAWLLLAGHAVCGAASLYGLIREARPACGESAPAEAEGPGDSLRGLRRIYACRVYGALSALLALTIHLLAVMLTVSRLAGTAPEALLPWAVLTACVCLPVREAAGRLLERRSRRRGREPESALLALSGLFLLICGLLTLRAFPADGAFLLCPACFVCGGVFCALGLSRMEADMERTAAFAGIRDLPLYRQTRSEGMDAAALAGQALALAGLVLVFCRAGSLQDAPEALKGFPPPALLLPMALLLCAVPLALRYPVGSRTAARISRFLRLAEGDPCRDPLRRDLEARVATRRKQAYGIRVLRVIVRCFCRQKLAGAEHIRPDPDNPLVFLCNHGEIFGPVACVCNIPTPIRCWSIDRMMDPDIGADYLYRYTVSGMGFIPQPLKKPFAAFLSHLSCWCMDSLESIPVYRDKPTQLMKTFRLSVEAMQCGDNLLIFPENPNAVSFEHGYEREGVGELFSGFAMLAQIYYSRTGKRCRFLPMFAHKNNRVLAFGEEIVFNPDADPALERERIAREAAAAMQALYEEQERSGRGAEYSRPGSGQ